MYFFYSPHIDTPEHTLSPAESVHCARVLRLKESDTVHVTDGKGKLCAGRLLEANPRGCRVLITEVTNHYGARPYRLHMAVAPTKNMERFEWFVEKATEAGTDTINPIICERSERKICKTERSERVAAAALKQCKRAQMPEIRQAVAFQDFLNSGVLKGAQAAIACCFTDEPRTSITQWIKQAGNDLVVLIGPEGDFSPAEIEAAIQAGCTPIDLGPAILRTETAALGVVFLAASHFLYL